MQSQSTSPKQYTALIDASFTKLAKKAILSKE